MGWDFEIPHTSNNKLSGIEVGGLYSLKTWKPKVVKRLLVGVESLNISSAPPENTIDNIVIPLNRVTYNISTGDTELQVMMNGELRVLPGWMIGGEGELLVKL
jgi:hypothetical protein